MKNLKIPLLIFFLLISSLCLNMVEAENPPKCPVKIIISEDKTVSLNVDSGTVCSTLLNEYLPESPRSDGKVFSKWHYIKQFNEKNEITDTKDTTSFTAVWITEEEYKHRQDSALWERIQPYANAYFHGLEDSQETSSSNIFELVAIIIALLLSIVSLLLALLLNGNKKRKLKNKVVEIVVESDRLAKWRDQGNFSGNSTGYASYENEIRNLKMKVAGLEDAYRNAQTVQSANVTPVPPKQKPQSTPRNNPSPQRMLYAESIIDGVFNRVKEIPGEDAIFELKLKGDSRASITVYKAAYNKILANPSYLEGCEKQLIGNASVGVEREGVAEKNENGKWVVITPPKVILR